jgi:hypothetical protein
MGWLRFLRGILPGAFSSHLPESLCHRRLGGLVCQDAIVDIPYAIEREIGLIFV